MERLRYESYYRNRGVCPEISEGRFVVALMEGDMVVDGLARGAKALITWWRYCGGWGMTIQILSM